jgi:hypothetical protein
MVNPDMVRELRSRIAAAASKDADKRPSVTRVITKALELLNAAENISVAATSVRQNVMIPVEGRRKQLRDGLTENCKKVQRIQNEIDDAFRALANERRVRELLPKAPTDPVSIQIRAELRQRLAAMDTAARLNAVRLDNLDAATLQAIFEAPAVLTGLPQQIVNGLRKQLVAAKGVSVSSFDATEQELTALNSAALAVARSSVAESSESEPHEVAGRFSSVQSEFAVMIDHSDADMPTLLNVAKGREKPAVAA